MRDFELDERGDIVIKKGDIQLTSGEPLTAQRIKMIWGTKKGEWQYDEDEGINTRAFLGKKPDESEMQDNLRDGLRQVDETLQLSKCEFTTIDRKLTIKATVERENGETIVLSIGETSSTPALVVCRIDGKTILDSGSAIDAISVCAENIDVYHGDL